jgi:glutamate racemase
MVNCLLVLFCSLLNALRVIGRRNRSKQFHLELLPILPPADSKKTMPTNFPLLDAPLLIFDSGIGGLSVLRSIKRAMPNAPLIYAADYAGLPYGSKSEAEIASRVPALLGRLVERYQPSLVVIACNTACTIALEHVRAALNVPVVGTVPAIKPASLLTKSGVIGLLGTQTTVRHAYVDRLEAEFAKGMVLLRHAAPELVHAAEAKIRGEVVANNIYQAAMAGLMGQAGGSKLDAVVLGCTHFPLVQNELANAANDSIMFVDGSDGIARRVAFLSENRIWPAHVSEGLFVTTGASDVMKPYFAKLAEYGLTHFDRL